MTTKTEQLSHAEGFLLSEANGHRSRAAVVIGAGENLIAGTVLGKATESGKYRQFDEGATNGLENAAGILLANCDATLGDVEAAILIRDAEVNADRLTWPDGISANDKAAGVVELTALGIIVRPGPTSVSTQTT